MGTAHYISASSLEESNSAFHARQNYTNLDRPFYSYELITFNFYTSKQNAFCLQVYCKVNSNLLTATDVE